MMSWRSYDHQSDRLTEPCLQGRQKADHRWDGNGLLAEAGYRKGRYGLSPLLMDVVGGASVSGFRHQPEWIIRGKATSTSSVEPV